jgi:hypothetical protein
MQNNGEAVAGAPLSGIWMLLSFSITAFIPILAHRYLMSRLSLQVFYLWRHESSTAPPFIFWWSNLEILFAPFHRSSHFIGELRCQAIQTENGPNMKERTKKQSILWDVYVLAWIWCRLEQGLNYVTALELDGQLPRRGTVWGRMIRQTYSRTAFSCGSADSGQSTRNFCKINVSYFTW